MKDVTIVVGTIGQSIMRSEDNGQTWARIGPRRGFAYEASVRCIAMHPKQHNILFAGTERGLYRSEDRGRELEVPRLGAQSSLCLGDRYRSGESRQCVCRHRHADAGDAVSLEGRRSELGETAGGSGDGVRGRRHAAIHGNRRRSAGAESYLGGLEVDGARHSSDGGDTWSIVDVTGRRDIHNVAVTAGPPKTVFIMANREIYASTDNGKSWEPRDMQKCLPWEYPRKENYLRGIAVDPANPKRILLGFGDFTPGTSGAIAQSEDFCKKLEAVATAGGTELDHVDVRDEFG